MLDPFSIKKERANEYFEKWKAFCSHKTSLKNTTWINRSHIIHPVQRDSFSCGVFVSFFLKELLLQNLTITFDSSNANLIKMRNEMLSSIIKSFLE